MTHEVSSRLSTLCSGDFKVYPIPDRRLGHKKFFKVPVMHMDMFQGDPADPEQPVGYNFFALAEAVVIMSICSECAIEQQHITIRNNCFQY